MPVRKTAEKKPERKSNRVFFLKQMCNSTSDYNCGEDEDSFLAEDQPSSKSAGAQFSVGLPVELTLRMSHGLVRKVSGLPLLLIRE